MQTARRKRRRRRASFLNARRGAVREKAPFSQRLPFPARTKVFSTSDDQSSWQNHRGRVTTTRGEGHGTAGIIDGYTLPRYLAREGGCLYILRMSRYGFLLLPFRVACKALIWSRSGALLRCGRGRRFSFSVLLLLLE